MHHKNLDVWKFSIDLVVDIYQLCSFLPSSEKYGISSQMKRAAVSIPSNIAEGAAKDSTKDYIRFLNIAIGSISELDTQLIIAEKLDILNDASIFQKVKRVRMLLIGLKKSLKKHI